MARIDEAEVEEEEEDEEWVESSPSLAGNRSRPSLGASATQIHLAALAAWSKVVAAIVAVTPANCH